MSDRRVGARKSAADAGEGLDIRVLLAVNVLAAVLAPVVLKAWNPQLFTAAEDVFFALESFVVLTVIEIGLIVRKVATQTRADFILWEARSTLDSKVYEIRRLFHKVCENSLGPNDLFVSFFDRRIEQLEGLLVDATTKQEIRIDESMFQVTSELLYSAFEGRPSDVFRALHFCSDNGFFFDIHAKHYFRQAYDLVQCNKLTQVKRLIVFRSDAELESDESRAMIAFHSSNAKYDYRLLSDLHFTRILSDFGLEYLATDFGIYGEKYLYKGYVNRRDKIVGSYSKNPTEIRRFTDCFEACWKSPAARLAASATEPSKVSIDAFLRSGVSIAPIPIQIAQSESAVQELLVPSVPAPGLESERETSGGKSGSVEVEPAQIPLAPGIAVAPNREK